MAVQEKTKKNSEIVMLEDAIQIDIGIAADKASAILQFVIQDYFDMGADDLNRDTTEAYCLLAAYGSISSMLEAVDDYLQKIRGTVNRCIA